MQGADLPHEAAHGSDEALAAGQPGAEPKGPTPNTECEDGLHRPSAADCASAAPLANLALRADASTPGGAPQRDPPETRAGSETREATPNTPERAAEGGKSPDRHSRDDDSFDAFMDSCREDPHAVPAPAVPSVHPEPRGDQAEDAPLTASRRAHLQRDYTALGQVTTEGEGQPTASGAADRTADERGAPGEGARVEAATNTASEPIGPSPGTAPPWGRGHLDYARLEGYASHPSEQAEHAATQDLGLRIPRLITREQLALAVSIRWVLSWRAALRVRTAMQDHGIWEIPGSPGYQGHTSGHLRSRSQDVPEPCRQAARRNSPERPQGPPPGKGSPFGTYRSPLRPFAPPRGR